MGGWVVGCFMDLLLLFSWRCDSVLACQVPLAKETFPLLSADLSSAQIRVWKRQELL